MSCPKLSIPGIPDPAFERERNMHQNYEYLRRTANPQGISLYREIPLGEKRQPGTYVHPLHRIYIQEGQPVPMDEHPELEDPYRFQLFQRDMARLQAEKEGGLRCLEPPLRSPQRATNSPSIYAPPARLPPDRHGIRLVPQPSISPEDPLNWSWWKKHAVMAALIPGCVLSDWTLTWGTTVFELQAPEWYKFRPQGRKTFMISTDPV
jgi:hypothetical protein